MKINIIHDGAFTAELADGDKAIQARIGGAPRSLDDIARDRARRAYLGEPAPTPWYEKRPEILV